MIELAPIIWNITNIYYFKLVEFICGSWKNIDSPSHSTEWKRDRWDILTQHMIYILDDVSQTRSSRFNIKKDPGLHLSFLLEIESFYHFILLNSFGCTSTLNKFWAFTENQLRRWLDLTKEVLASNNPSISCFMPCNSR